MGTRSSRPTLALLVVTVIWGWTFVWMKQALNAAGEFLPEGNGGAAIALFMTLRFGLAAALLPVVLPRARKLPARREWATGSVLGFLLLAGFLLQMGGLEELSPPVSAFLTSLYVVFTALLATLLHRRLPGKRLAAGVVLATLGAGFIDGPPEITLGRGALLTVAGALVFALHILATDALTRRVRVLPLTLVMFLVVTLGSAAALLLGLADPGAPGPAVLLELAWHPAFLAPLLLTATLATVLALSLINAFQKEVPPVRAAVLYALEPVWAALAALALGMQEPGAWLLAGGLALLSGNLLANRGPARRRERPAPDRGGQTLQ